MASKKPLRSADVNNSCRLHLQRYVSYVLLKMETVHFTIKYKGDEP